jgi:hypothetical protein
MSRLTRSRDRPENLQKAYRAPDLKQQHVGLHRKVLMRKHMLRFVGEGAAYVPFIGDGDIAKKLYSDRYVLGADIDPERIEECRKKGLVGELKVADCDHWPFPTYTLPVAIADFDAYIEPYVSFRAFWAQATKADRLVVSFTDGRKQGMMRSSWWMTPDGEHLNLGKVDKHPVYNKYLTEHIWPWFDGHIGEGWRVVHRFRYQRDMMIYWSAAICRR